MADFADLVSLFAQAKPAGGAALDQVIIATVGAGIATAVMLYLITRHRNRGDGRADSLGRLLRARSPVCPAGPRCPAASPAAR